ncbi:MAG: hypothetical protein QOD32_1839 [Pyrinomonadaceae bacterium]|jgi:hypothetical protein|nr:hypothetical protein [Pyrinomonadaceae bacterium]
MRLVDVNTFQCRDGERITVNITFDGTLDGARMALNHHSLLGNSFVIDKDANPISDLTIFMVFSQPDGGVYNIQITGDPDEETYQEDPPITQQGREETSIGYEFV